MLWKSEVMIALKRFAGLIERVGNAIDADGFPEF